VPNHVTLKILAILLAVGVVIYGWHRNDLRRLTRDYACKEPFAGAIARCIVRFPLDEASTDCMLGANSRGLYISSSIDALEKSRRWSFRYYASEHPSLFLGIACKSAMRNFRCEGTFDSACLQIGLPFLFPGRLAGCC
jgi:hypothetical protein